MDYTNSVGMDMVPSGLALATGGFFIFNFLLGIVLFVVGIILIIRMFKAMRHIEEMRNMMETMSKKTTTPIEKKMVVVEKKTLTPSVKKVASPAKPKK